jgi:hypothetical protein
MNMRRLSCPSFSTSVKSKPHLRPAPALWRRAGWLLLCVALLVGQAPLAASASASDSKISYSIPKTVSAEDAVYVREGITLAQTYVTENLSDISSTPLVINVRNSDDPTNAHSVAFSSAGYIVFFTGSPGWIRLSPFDRVHVVVHEYIHAYQYAKLHDDEDSLPAWFLEGMAEYLSYDAVIQLGLVRAQDVRDYQAWAVASNPGLSTLDNLEDPNAFYSEYGPVYSLAYLAFDDLLSGHSPAALDRLFIEIRADHNWQSAFEDVFGQDLDSFYRAFAEAQDELIAPVSRPDPFVPINPVKFKSAVSIDSITNADALGEQMTVLAYAHAGAICQLRLRGEESGEAITRTTFADASGHLFWLVTIPATMGQGPAAMTATCGGEPSAVEIEITNSD